jgi:hypothetical protein
LKREGRDLQIALSTVIVWYIGGVGKLLEWLKSGGREKANFLSSFERELESRKTLNNGILSDSNKCIYKGNILDSGLRQNDERFF